MVTFVWLPMMQIGMSLFSTQLLPEALKDQVIWRSLVIGKKWEINGRPFRHAALLILLPIRTAKQNKMRQQSLRDHSVRFGNGDALGHNKRTCPLLKDGVGPLVQEIFG